MDRFYLFFLALGLGFFTAIPVGGSQIEAAKRAIHGYLWPAIAVTLGSVSSDIMYGVIALFGFAPFLEAPRVRAVFSAAGAVVLWGLAFWTIRESRKPHEFRLTQSSLKSKRRAYLTGFSLAATNPQLVLTWLYGITLARHLGLADPLTNSVKVIFLFGGALGLWSYIGLLTLMVHRIKHFIPMKSLRRIYLWMGVGLFLLSFYFVYIFIRDVSRAA